MHPDVLPDPTAPRTMTPVYSPRCGIVSHVGLGARPGMRVKCVSPRTRLGSGLDSGGGYRGKERGRTACEYLYAAIVNNEVANDAARKGVVNHSVAYPYVSTSNTNGRSSRINAKKGSSSCTG